MKEVMKFDVLEMKIVIDRKNKNEKKGIYSSSE